MDVWPKLLPPAHTGSWDTFTLKPSMSFRYSLFPSIPYIHLRLPKQVESPGPQVPIWEVSVPLPWTDFL